MITHESIVQAKAFSRQDGFLLSLVWIGSMASMMYMPESSWGPLMMLSTPFFVGWRLTSFRNNALDGVISFRRALYYTFFTFMYASLIFALAQYLYFKFLDQGRFFQMMSDAVVLLTEAYKQQGIDPAELSTALQEAKNTSPVNMSFLFMMYNMMLGTIMSPVIAICCKKDAPRNSSTFGGNNDRKE